MNSKHFTLNKLVLGISLLLLGSAGFSQEKKWLRKAAASVENCNYDEAISYYNKILDQDTGSYYGNAGKGVVLSEYMDKHEAAIPYLQRALRKSPDKTKFKLNYDLAKSYHRIGNYLRAMYFYNKAQELNKEDNPDYDVYLNKRVEDCRYAIEHRTVMPEQWASVRNVGRPVNSEFPEYCPVFVNNEMIYTAQRKDTKRERKNGIDGRYWESMYICNFKNQSFSEPRRFTLPDDGDDSKFLKHNEAILSASADGKKLFIYRNAKVYEADLNEPGKGPEKMSKKINFSHLQSHACLSPDGRTLYFASESKRGDGAIDIYSSEKLGEGKWSDPVLLPFNSQFNEDAPFMTEDGTLYFASNGLPGYGGYDIYKTKLENGNWKKPENLGQPINSAGDEIYFSLLPNSSYGYYSSSRPGGIGDMDIYQVHYIPMETPDCQPYNPAIFAIDASRDANNQSSYFMSMKMPEKYAASDLNVYNWKVNDVLVSQQKNFEYDFNTPGVYTVAVKAIVFCDSCPNRAALCTETLISIGEKMLALNTASIETKENNPNVNTENLISRNNETLPQKHKKTGEQRELTESDLAALGWKNGSVTFAFNQSGIQPELKELIDNNIDVLKKNKDLRVVISGYTDSRGSSDYNKNLSARRAATIKNYLVSQGIAQNRISIKAYGESRLLNQCSDGVQCSEEEHAVNRRVEFQVYERSSAPVTLK